MTQPSHLDRPADMPARNLVTTTKVRPGVVVVEVRGEIDASTGSEWSCALDAALTGEPRPDVLVADLDQVGFLDSSGLSVLLRTARAAAAAEVDFRVSTGSRPVLRIFEITALDQVLALYGTRAEAVRG